MGGELKEVMTYRTNKTYKTNESYRKKGGYESLIVYWIATSIYDLTVLFCKTYMSYKTYKSYRTQDQMIQAARSGKQNIVEGSLENSVEGNLKLSGIAKASYGELLEDYRDYLRQHDLTIWTKDDARVFSIRRTRDLPYRSYKTYRTYMTYTGEAEGFANLMITLCFKQLYLMDKLLQAIQQKFISEGGFRENLFRKRLAFRSKQAFMLIVILLLTACMIAPVHAQDSYRLEYKQFNFEVPTPNPTTDINPIKTDQKPASVYDDKGYIIKQGFDYLTSDQPFSFAFDPGVVDFGNLFPDQPVVKEVKLTIGLGGSPSYQVLALAHDNLKTQNQQQIKPVACDNKVTDACTPLKAAFWDKHSSYGFGFSVAGPDALADFNQGKRFRPFSKRSSEPQAVQILARYLPITDQVQNRLILKVNVAEDQPGGLYQNTLELLALPGY